SGFWDPVGNVIYFCDVATSARFQLLARMRDEMRKREASDAERREPDTVHHRKVLDFLMEVERENLDVTAVSHVGSHQMAGNTGIFPRRVAIPIWAREGLATYFEIPSDGAWAGIGAVSFERLNHYRPLADFDPMRYDIDFIVRGELLG